MTTPDVHAERPPANLCRTCGKDFAYLSGFDAHRVGTYDYTHTQGLQQEPPVEDGRRCLTTEEMNESGFHIDRWGRWLSAGRNSDVERVVL